MSSMKTYRSSVCPVVRMGHQIAACVLDTEDQTAVLSGTTKRDGNGADLFLKRQEHHLLPTIPCRRTLLW